MIYSLSTCPHCKKAKEYLSNRAGSYVDYDVGRTDRRPTSGLCSPLLLVDFPQKGDHFLR
ncbi:MAG: glutaredoxin domain-containing protein [Candidatus Thorarchaeota archaeon]